MSVRPYDESELGIGAADHAPRFALDSKRLDDKAGVRITLFALDALARLCVAALLGLAFGFIMLRLHP